MKTTRRSIAIATVLAAVSACGGDDDAKGGASTSRANDGQSTVVDAKSPGADLYASGCAPCHGARGEGTQIAPALSDSARSVERVVQTVQSGVATVGPPHTPMPARGDGTWSDAQIHTVAEYVHSLAR